MTTTTTDTFSTRLLPAPGRVAALLFTVAFTLLALSLTGLFARFYTDYDHLHRYVHRLVEKTTLDGELSIPAFFAVLLLLLSAGLLRLIALTTLPTTSAGTSLRRRWNVLALIFLALAVDEAAGLHELMITLRHYVPTQNKYLFYAWVIPGLLFAATVFVLYVPFLRALPRRTAGLLLLAGALYVGGAAGIEMLSAAYRVDHGEFSFGYTLIANIEETFEMSGLITFIYALLDYLHRSDRQLLATHAAVSNVVAEPSLS